MVGPLTTFVAYLLGSIPFGYLIVRWHRGIDVRSTGSGSIGATNVMRNLGLPGFAMTFLLDFGKGVAAIMLASRWTGNDPRWVAAAAVASISGHCFPVWLKFRGGKGVATAAGVFTVIAPFQVLWVLLVFAIVVAIWRYISLGSITAMTAFPILLYIQSRLPFPMVLGSAVCAAIMIVRHHANIRRLLKGTENRLGRKPVTSDQ